MPIYEYQCTHCGRVQEILQKISDKPLTKCSRCSGRMHKLISQSSFHLKGTGWYVTDYANKSGTSKAAAKTSKEKSSGSETGSKTGSDASPSSPSSEKS
jgi:putative FmdB family regulatory protein